MSINSNLINIICVVLREKFWSMVGYIWQTWDVDLNLSVIVKISRLVVALLKKKKMSPLGYLIEPNKLTEKGSRL